MHYSVILLYIIIMPRCSQFTHSTGHCTPIPHQHTQRLCADLEDREAQLLMQEEEMQRQDAEISRLVGELRALQLQAQKV